MFINFTKMHGLGNDFVVIDAINQDIQLDSEQVRFLADRHMGIGCDQLLLVEKPQSDQAEFRYRIFNADGNEVEQCGNGARCFARFVREKQLSKQSRIPVETRGGLIELELHDDNTVTVCMGSARLEPREIPFIADRQSPFYALEVADEVWDIGAVSMGNPHAVLRVDDIDSAKVSTLGPRIEHHPRFPDKANVSFMQVIDRENIRLRVWERGCGETLACGTGACAAVVVGNIRGWLEPQVVVHLSKGQLTINWQGNQHPVYMTGPAETVFEGKIQL